MNQRMIRKHTTTVSHRLPRMVRPISPNDLIVLDPEDQMEELWYQMERTLPKRTGPIVEQSITKSMTKK